MLLVGFNLIPAFPLDGGRMLRAGLSFKFGRRRGTRIAAIIGKMIAVAMLIGGYFLTWPSLAIIGIFVFVTASIEYKTIANEAVLQEEKVSSIVNYNYPKIDKTRRCQKSFIPILLEQGLILSFWVH